MSVGQMSVGQMSVGQMSVGQMSVDEMVFDEKSSAKFSAVFSFVSSGFVATASTFKDAF